ECVESTTVSFLAPFRFRDVPPPRREIDCQDMPPRVQAFFKGYPPSIPSNPHTPKRFLFQASDLAVWKGVPLKASEHKEHCLWSRLQGPNSSRVDIRVDMKKGGL